MLLLTAFGKKVNMMYVVPADNKYIIGLTLLYPDSKN